MEKFLIVSEDDESSRVRKLAEVLENHFDLVIIAKPAVAFRTFAKEEPDCVLVRNCDDTSASTPEAKIWKDLKVVVGNDRIILRCGGNHDGGSDYLKEPFLLGHLMGKIEALKALKV